MFITLDEFYLDRWYYRSWAKKQGKNWPNARDPPMVSEENHSQKIKKSQQWGCFQLTVCTTRWTQRDFVPVLGAQQKGRLKFHRMKGENGNKRDSDMRCRKWKREKSARPFSFPSVQLQVLPRRAATHHAGGSERNNAHAEEHSGVTAAAVMTAWFHFHHGVH
jgi:hypothetical protein